MEVAPAAMAPGPLARATQARGPGTARSNRTGAPEASHLRHKPSLSGIGRAGTNSMPRSLGRRGQRAGPCARFLRPTSHRRVDVRPGRGAGPLTRLSRCRSRSGADRSESPRARPDSLECVGVHPRQLSVSRELKHGRMCGRQPVDVGVYEHDVVAAVHRIVKHGSM